MESEKWHLRICLFLLFITSSYSNVGKITSSQNLFGNTVMSQFNTKNNTRVIAQKGGLAILPCVVKVNSPATVSWIRRKDFQLLTVGLSTHSSDKRFLVEHTRHMGHWSLRIKAVKEEDRGLYECQLSIYPTQSIFIELKIVEAVAEISNSSDILIDESSTLQLQCKLKGATENPSFVFWYHENKMINYDAQGGFVVTSITENSLPSPENGYLHQSKTSSGKNKTKNSSKEPIGVNSINTSNVLSLPVYTSPVTPLSTLQLQQLKSPYLPNSSMSVLTIKTVTFHHAGNYTCAPSNARPASITVHVLRGEKPAAMQHANRSIIDGEYNANNSFGLNSIKGLNGTNTIIISVPSLILSLLCFLVNQLSASHFQRKALSIIFLYIICTFNS